MCDEPSTTDYGIAIGPILFVVALLGLLAAAIAAGSGVFTGTTTSEADRANAAALIEIGQNLKFGVDRIVGNGYEPTVIVADPVATTNDTDLFAPVGGGIAPPSTTLLTANVSGTNWQYLFTTSTGGWGTAAEDYIAYGRVASEALCIAINQKANGLTTAPTVGIALMATGNPGHTAFNPNFGLLRSKLSGCFYTNHVWSLGYWFFQVLAIRQVGIDRPTKPRHFVRRARKCLA